MTLTNHFSILVFHQQNLVPGLRPRIPTKAHDRVCGFFMCKARLHPNNGEACRGTERFAGSFVAGSLNPVRLTTLQIETLLVVIGIATKVKIMKTMEVTSFFFEDNSVRTLILEDNTWFVAQDLCSALHLSNSRMALRALDNDEKGVSSTYTPGGNQEVAIVSESGMYTLILRCRDAVKPGTLPHRFRKWVTNEVLPQIRKSGSYQHPAIGHRFNGKLLLTVKEGCLVCSETLPENKHVLTLAEYLELAGKAGYIVIHQDDLKALAAGKKCSFPAR